MLFRSYGQIPYAINNDEKIPEGSVVISRFRDGDGYVHTTYIRGTGDIDNCFAGILLVILGPVALLSIFFGIFESITNYLDSKKTPYDYINPAALTGIERTQAIEAQHRGIATSKTIGKFIIVIALSVSAICLVVVLISRFKNRTKPNNLSKKT